MTSEQTITEVFTDVLIANLKADRERILKRNAANMRRWRSNNRERSRELVRQSSLRHPETKRRCAKQWYQANKGKAAVSRRRWDAANPEKKKASRLAWWEKNGEKKLAILRHRYKNDESVRAAKKAQWVKRYAEKKDEILAKSRQAYHSLTVEQKLEKNQKAREWCKLKRATDPVFRIKCSMRARLAILVRTPNRKSKLVHIIGCDGQQLRAHLESQWQPGMLWKNYGRKNDRNGWVVDHKKPLKSFNLADENEFAAAWHYTNFQPLWDYENSMKNCKLDYIPSHKPPALQPV